MYRSADCDESLEGIVLTCSVSSSLATGSMSHKAVTKEVSNILWYYYNDPVSLVCSALLYGTETYLIENLILLLCRQRIVLHLSLSHQKVAKSFRHFHWNRIHGLDLATTIGRRYFSDMLPEERLQRGSALESKQDIGWLGPGGAGAPQKGRSSSPSPRRVIHCSLFKPNN